MWPIVSNTSYLYVRPQRSKQAVSNIFVSESARWQPTSFARNFLDFFQSHKHTDTTTTLCRTGLLASAFCQIWVLNDWLYLERHGKDSIAAASYVNGMSSIHLGKGTSPSVFYDSTCLVWLSFAVCAVVFESIHALPVFLISHPPTLSWPVSFALFLSFFWLSLSLLCFVNHTTLDVCSYASRKAGIKLNAPWCLQCPSHLLWHPLWHHMPWKRWHKWAAWTSSTMFFLSGGLL